MHELLGDSWFARLLRAGKKVGPPLGIGSPKGRAPVTRPRRDRAMGSSILASLSEAGGNNPLHPVNGPLPPRSPDSADRVGTRPTRVLLQAVAQSVDPLNR